MKKKRKLKKIKKNYFNKFWDGELSLPVSYWLFGLVYAFFIALIIILIAEMMGFPDSAIGILILPWTIFWAIGCWRSCFYYKGSKIWPVLAKISIVLGLISGIVDAVVGI